MCLYNGPFIPPYRTVWVLRILDVYGVLELFLAADPDHDLYNIEDLFLLLIFSFLVNLRIPATSSHLSNLPCSMLYNQLVAQWDEDKLEAIPAYRTIRKDLKKKYFMLLRSLMYTNQYLWLPKAHKTDCFYLVLNNNFSILFMKTLNLADFFWGFLKAEKRTNMVLFVISM